MDQEQELDAYPAKLPKVGVWFLWTMLWLAVAVTTVGTCFLGAFLITLLGSWWSGCCTRSAGWCWVSPGRWSWRCWPGVWPVWTGELHLKLAEMKRDDGSL